MFPQKDSKGQRLALEIEKQDKYHPKKTGLHNVLFASFAGDMDKSEREDHAKYQQWWFDEKNHKLTTKAFQNKVLFQGQNKNLVIYDNKNMKN